MVKVNGPFSMKINHFKITLPYFAALSSNKRVGIRRNSKNPVYKKAGYLSAQKIYIQFFKMKFKNSEFLPRKKVFISGVVYKDSNRSDAHNLIKGLFDALQKGINTKGVTDNYFSIALWDYNIDKENTRIELEVWQERSNASIKNCK